jgi:Fur family ferric uptake transcriptional regulator
VYRNLESLEQLGLVRHVHLGHGPGLYALAGPAREYLVCESCDATIAVDESQLDDVRDLLKARFGYEAHFSHFPIVGLCAACAAEPAPSAHHR